MFRRLGGQPENLNHLRRVEGCVRKRFRLAEDALVLVSEERPLAPEFLARETVARFWVGAERYRLRIFKPASEIGVEDVLVGWLLPSLVDDGLPDCR